MDVSRSLARATAALVLGVLTGCGGGGGDGGSGGGGGGGAPLAYSGNTSPAVITTSNAAQLTGNVVGGGDVSAATSGLTGGTAADAGQGALDVGRRLNRSVRAIHAKRADGSPQLRSAIPIDDTSACTGGGTVRTVGTLSDGGTGTVSVFYANCREGDDTLNGQATMRIDTFVFGIGITDYTLSFSRLTFRSPDGSSLDMTGSLRAQLDIGNNSETITENVVTLDNTGHMTKSENLAFVDVYDNVFAPTSFVESITGRVFDSVHGFVDITTIAPFVFRTLAQSLPDGGQIQLTGAQNTSIRATALFPNVVRLALDLNGDGVFERVATMRWSDLSGPVGGDLADNDADGMHNSWETANLLNPNLDDAASDNDGDGFSNLAEYQGAGNPNNGAVIPGLLVGHVFPAASDLATANSDTANPGRSAVGSDGTNYLLVSCREFGTTVGLFGVSISESGQVLNNFPISNETCPRHSAVAFDGNNYLVVLSRNAQLFGIRVTPAGAVLDGSGGFPISSIVDGSSNHSASVAFDGTNYLVVWVKFLGGNRIHGARVTPAGVVLNEFAITSGGSESGPVLAFDGTNYFVVWTRLGASPGLEDVFGARVSRAGAVLDSPAIAIATLADRQLATGVAFDGTNYLVVWDHLGTASVFPPPDGRIFGRRLSATGALLDGTATSGGIAISTGLFQNHSSSVAFAGSTFVVTWAVSSFPNFPPAGILDRKSVV